MKGLYSFSLRGARSGAAARTLSYKNAWVFTAWFSFHGGGLASVLGSTFKAKIMPSGVIL